MEVQPRLLPLIIVPNMLRALLPVPGIKKAPLLAAADLPAADLPAADLPAASRPAAALLPAKAAVPLAVLAEAGLPAAVQFRGLPNLGGQAVVSFPLNLRLAAVLGAPEDLVGKLLQGARNCSLFFVFLGQCEI